MNNMDRCKVICHMMISIDGKIDGNYMDEKGNEQIGDFYDKQIWEMGNANGSGSLTAKMYFANNEIDYSKYKDVNIDYSDNIIKSQYYWVVFDRFGKCNWESNTITYGNKTASLLICLTSNVKKEYLAHLKALNISYIISNGNEIDYDKVLFKLRNIFNINTLVLTGGAIINGVFYEKGLIDEISLVVAPYIEGLKEYKNFIEVNKYSSISYKIDKVVMLDNGGIQLLYKKA